jgi:hypothetical protein
VPARDSQSFTRSRTEARCRDGPARFKVGRAGEIDECRDHRPGASANGLDGVSGLQNYEAVTTDRNVKSAAGEKRVE